MVFANLYAMNRDKDIWGEDALKFDPDRFFKQPGLNHCVVLRLQLKNLMYFNLLVLGQDFALVSDLLKYSCYVS